MPSIEDGGWEKPYRPRASNPSEGLGKKKEFIPIEEISEEDVAPGFFSQKTPEDELIEKEEEEDAVERDLFTAYREQQEIKNQEEWYAWEHRQEDETYREYLKKLGREFDDTQGKHEQLEILMDKYHLPRKISKDDIEKLVAKHRSGRSYGYRGRENRSKHQKGMDTVRKPNNLE